MTDFTDLKERLDLHTEVEKDLGQPKNGHWHCPFCQANGGKSLPLSVHGQGYKCFGCGRSGDLITWLREYRGMSWQDIKDLAGSDSLPPPRPRPAQPEPEPSGPPSPEWQARGLAFMDYCEAQLWGDPGSKDKFIDGLSPLEYLRQRRGLQDDVIRAYCLGWNPGDIRDKSASWGIPEDPEGRGVWLPRGIVIPWLIGGALWAVNIRRLEDDPKYIKVLGSKAALFGADTLAGAEVILLTEGELDAILADQILYDVAGVASLGSASNGLDVPSWGVYLLPARAILAAYDLDGPGKIGLAKLVKKSAQIHGARVPSLRAGGKDITDYVLAGGDLREWLRYNLDRLGALAGVEV